MNVSQRRTDDSSLEVEPACRAVGPIIAPLPGVAPSIAASLAAHGPNTGTPTSAALQGAIQLCAAWQSANPTHVVVNVLATDGLPQQCNADPRHIEAIAAAGYVGPPSIPTYVIGIGPALEALDGVAAAGGTTTAFHVGLDPNANQQLLDALNQIRGGALGCTYTIPVPETGTPDFAQVNVTYTPGDGTPQVVPKVEDKSQCPPSGEAWYYDDNDAPSQIIVCDPLCEQLSADARGQVEIVIGCQTIIK